MKVHSTFSNIFFILKNAFRNAPFTIIFFLLQDIIQQIFIFVKFVLLPAELINAIQFGKSFQWAFFINILVLFFATAKIFVFDFFQCSVFPIGFEKVSKGIKEMLYQKAASMDLSDYDNPKFYNEYIFIINDIEKHIMESLSTVSKILGTLAILIIQGTYIFSVNSIGVVFAIISFVINFLSNKYIAKLEFNMELSKKAYEHRKEYVSRVFYLPEFSKEIRLSNIKEKLYQDFRQNSQMLRDNIERNTKKITLVSIFQTTVNSILSDGICLLYFLHMTIVKSALSYGEMVAMLNTTKRLSDCLTDWSTITAEVSKENMYIEKIRVFLERDAAIRPISNENLCSEKGKHITCENLCFSYDNKFALLNINMKIQTGEKVAFVGYNGSGKSTLIKLLLRLYDPTHGKICYGDTDIKDLDINVYRQKFSTIFQDYQIFATSLSENIVLKNDVEDEEKVKNILGILNMEKVPLNSLLTKEFSEEGVELSGGEMQKVAIARSLYKNGEILILDEPTSALDPVSEYKFNRFLTENYKDKTVIIVSHRLSTIKFVDKIYMFENGKIVESGTHDELIKINGKYAEMFHIQQRGMCKV